MADTWRAIAPSIIFSGSKSLTDVFNATGTTKVVRVYRMWMWNNSVATVTTATGAHMRVRRITSVTLGASGSLVTPVSHDPNAAALDANTTVGRERLVTATGEFRRFPWWIDEASGATNTQQGWLLLVPNAEVWAAGYSDSVIQPLVCRSDEGVNLEMSGSYTPAAGAVIDTEIEFTSAGS